MTAQENHITELRPAVTKCLVFLVLSSAFAVGEIVITYQVSLIRLLMGILATVLGAAGIVASLAALLSKRMVLRLTPEGFSYGTLRKEYFYGWSDIAAFGVASIGVKRASFTLRGDYAGEDKLRIINQGAIGFDRLLPDNYGKKPIELARLLEDWRYRYSNIKTT